MSEENNDPPVFHERSEERFHQEASQIELLRLHSLWVETNGVEGEQLNLAGADLRRANLAGAILDEASLKGTRLLKADLSDSDLRGIKDAAALTGAAPPRWRELSQRTLSEARKRNLRSQSL